MIARPAPKMDIKDIPNLSTRGDQELASHKIWEPTRLNEAMRDGVGMVPGEEAGGTSSLFNEEKEATNSYTRVAD